MCVCLCVYRGGGEKYGCHAKFPDLVLLLGNDNSHFLNSLLPQGVCVCVCVGGGEREREPGLGTRLLSYILFGRQS